MNETWMTMVGTITTDVRHRQVGNGVEMTSFRMASNERRFDKESGQWGDGDSLYVSVTCWRRLATGVAASLSKGDPVVVRGRLHTREFEQDGQRRWSTEMEANSVGPDLSRCAAQILRGGTPGPVGSRAESLNASARPVLQPAGSTGD